MKTKLIFSEHDKNNHISTVVINTDLGEFTGIVLCQPCDYKHESRYFGCQLAELKAVMQYASAKRAAAANQLKGLDKYYKMMANTRNFCADDYWVRKLKDALCAAANDVQYWKDYRKSLKQTYASLIVSRDKHNTKGN